jgi:hypothetical protein
MSYGRHARCTPSYQMKILAESRGALRCKQKFLHFFPDGFRDETYKDWERNYKWQAHEQWTETLNQVTFRSLLRKRQFDEIARRAVRIEARTNLLFSFEKMGLRDAMRTGVGAQTFATGLYDVLHGVGNVKNRFERWIVDVGSLPRIQTRVLTWPVVTVFPFIAQPLHHIFLKPTVTKIAASEFGFHFQYESKPSWPTYSSLLNFASAVRSSARELRPRDMIDIQSFMWVQGSEEYD